MIGLEDRCLDREQAWFWRLSVSPCIGAFILPLQACCFRDDDERTWTCMYAAVIWCCDVISRNFDSMLLHKRAS
jgi:hypothetical protein